MGRRRVFEGGLALPSYLEHTSEVAAHHAELRSRGALVEIDGLSHWAGDEREPTLILDGIELRLREREFVCVVGPSGCGKSTLLRLLAGLEQPRAGELRLVGEAIEGPSAQRGLVPQSYSLFPWRTVLGNVTFGLEMRGIRRREARAMAHRFVELVGLGERASAYPRELSGGMQQRVAIARALVTEPQVLLMDEPFSALDAHTRARMRDHVLRIHGEVQATICFVTHDLDEAIYLADRVIVLSHRPAQIREIIEIPVSRPRRPEQLFSGPFLATRARLEQLIRSEDRRGDQAEPSRERKRTR